MEELTEIRTGIRLSHKALLFNIPLDHASITSIPAVRPSLEQTRTCVADLEDLIKLCNENLPILRAKPAIFRRTTLVIESARGAISQICQLLERMTTTTRPGSSSSGFSEPSHIQPHLYPVGHDNDTHSQIASGSQIQICFKNRWGRLSTEARNLISLCQQQLVAKEHGAVVNELNFMRQLVLIAPDIVKGPGGLGQDVQATASHQGGGEWHAPKTVWNNMGLLDEIIGGRNQNPLGRITTNQHQHQPQPQQQLLQQQQQQQQQTQVDPRPKLGSPPDYNFVLPPRYPGPRAKHQPVLRPSPSSLSVLSSTTVWNVSTDPDPAFKELPGAINHPTSTNAPTRPPHATHKSSFSSSATVFNALGVGLMYSDYGFGPSPGTGAGHHQKSSSSASFTPAKSAELPGFREPGELPATTIATSSGTFIYNHHQHTHNHNHNCQCHHHHYDHHNSPSYGGNQMEGTTMQHQHPQHQQQQQSGGGGHHTCNFDWEQQQQMNSTVWSMSVPAINEEQPQELSSVVFAPDPVELP